MSISNEELEFFANPDWDNAGTVASKERAGLARELLAARKVMDGARRTAMFRIPVAIREPLCAYLAEYGPKDGDVK